MNRVKPQGLESEDRRDRKFTIYLDPDLKKKVKHLAIDLDEDASRLVELSVRILLSIVKSGKVPDDLGLLLSKYDPEALEQLRELVEKIKSVEG